MRATRAFTLIELMIVIAIIGVLAAILIPNFLHARAESASSACEGNLKNIATALEEYAIDNGGQYPSGTQAVTPALFGGSPNNYLNATPVDPAGGAYTYVSPSNGVCGSGDAFKLRDGDQHDTTTLTQLPDYVNGVTGIRYCSSSGIHACNC